MNPFAYLASWARARRGVSSAFWGVHRTVSPGSVRWDEQPSEPIDWDDLRKLHELAARPPSYRPWPLPPGWAMTECGPLPPGWTAVDGKPRRPQ